MSKPINCHKILKQHWPWLPLVVGFIFLNSQHILDSDVGLILNAAWNIWHGRILYIDTFEFIPPLAPYLLAGWWQLTSVSFLSAEVLAWFISFSSVIALYLISRKLKINRWRFLAPALFIVSTAFWPSINHNAFSIAAIFWSLYLYLIAEKKIIYYLLSGFLVGISIICLQHKGLIVAGVLILWTIIKLIQKKNSLKQFLYFLIGCLVPIISLFFFWTPNLLYKNLILFPLINYPETNRLPLLLFIITCLVSIIIIKNSLSQKEKTTLSDRQLISLIGLGLLLTCLSRADYAHIFQIMGPIFILLAYILESKLRSRYYIQAISLVWFCSMSILLIWHPPFESNITKRFVETVKTTCSMDRLYSGPFMPGFYFETKTLSSTPYSMLITRQQTTEQFIEAAQLLEQNPPTCALINYETVKKFDYDTNNPVNNFFTTHYKLKQQIGSVQIFVPK